MRCESIMGWVGGNILWWWSQSNISDGKNIHIRYSSLQLDTIIYLDMLQKLYIVYKSIEYPQYVFARYMPSLSAEQELLSIYFVYKYTIQREIKINDINCVYVWRIIFLIIYSVSITELLCWDQFVYISEREGIRWV